MDNDRNRKLDLDEFKKGLRTYGVEVSDKDAEGMFREVDKDGNNAIDLTEFLESLRVSVHGMKRYLQFEKIPFLYMYFLFDSLRA